MKKSSRDYRKSRRKKWIRINGACVRTMLGCMVGAAQISFIQQSIGLTKEEKALKIAEQAIHTAMLVQKELSTI